MDENLYPQYVTRKAMESLIEKLNLPEPDEFEQDWEYLVSDMSRLPEFISFYENSILNKGEKFILMVIIIDSYNDALEAGCVQNDIWEKIRYFLLNEFEIHKRTIMYWALDDRDLEDCFAITPLIREIIKEYEEVF